MMSKRFTIVNILLVVFCLSAGAQHYYGKYYKAPLSVVEIKDSTFITIIDSLIDFEKRCDYYKPDLLFSVFLHMDSTVQVGAMEGRISEGAPNLGCFTYRGHLFVVGGRELNKDIFAVTDKKKTITYYEPSEKDVFQEDDSYTYWYYKYINGRFTLKSRHTFCE